MKYLQVFFSMFFVLSNAYATKNHWTCRAIDSELRYWDTKSEYPRVAMQRSLDDCKKHSIHPTSCESHREQCEYEGKEIPPTVHHDTQTTAQNSLWQCCAYDFNATPYLNTPFPNKEEAALRAKMYCKEKSSEPDTCYINVATCQNLKEGL